MIGVVIVRGGAPVFPGRYLGILLAVAVFLCHGVLGAQHEIASWGAAPAGASVEGLAQVDHAFSGHGGPMQGHPREHAPGQGGGNPVHSLDYAAVMFGIILLGTAVALLLGGVVPRGPSPGLVAEGRVSRPPVLPLPRGPTAPFLQVFLV
ncbi:hypothetical protein BH18ACT11_BH18ACT11_10880 [soil metagenome]